MAHFNLSLDDMADPAALNNMVLANQQNYSVTGKPTAMKTSGSVDPTPKQALTTWNVADILQGTVLYQPTGLSYTKFNEQLSADAETAMTTITDGRVAQLNGMQKSIVGYDLDQRPRYSASDLANVQSATFTPASGTGTASPSAIPTGGDAGFIFPLQQLDYPGPQGWFGPRDTGIAGASKYHKGLDLTNVGDPGNEPILCVKDGTVSQVGGGGGAVGVAGDYNGGAGGVVLVDHGGGLFTRYLHMNFLEVSVGQQLKQGEVLGHTGFSGVGSGAHLHFEVRINGEAVDAAPYLYGFTSEEGKAKLASGEIQN